MKKTTYRDYIYSGEKDTHGIITVSGKDAIENALRLWLVSFQGEIIRQPEYGGYVTKWLFQPLTEENANDMKNAIRIGMDAEFRPHITITMLKVTPDLEKEAWIVEMEGYVDATEEKIYIMENLRKQV